MSSDYDALPRPQAALAKIGNRYYWAIFRSRRPDEPSKHDLAIVRIVDGFVDTREDAAERLAVFFDQVDPGSEQELQRRLDDKRRGKRNRDCIAGRGFWGADRDIRVLARNPGKSFSWARAFSARGASARTLYRYYHGKRLRASGAADAQGDIGKMYTWHDSEWGPGWWDEHRIAKITNKRIFVRRDDRRGDGHQLRFERAKVDKEGGAWFHGGTATQWFYSGSGKVKLEEERAEWRREAKVRGRAALSEYCELLGVGETYTRTDVITAFRQQARKHHPDKGDAAMYRRLVEAKDRILAAMEVEFAEHV